MKCQQSLSLSLSLVLQCLPFALQRSASPLHFCSVIFKIIMCEKSSRFTLNELNQDLLEKVLAWLPTSSFFRLTSVCKRWKSAASSAIFRRACSQVPERDPWFFMVDSQPPHTARLPIIYDTAEGNWKQLNHAPPLRQDDDSVSVASSSGLICFRRNDGGFVVCNPVTASFRHLPPPAQQPPTRAIAMMSEAESFSLFIISGELPNLTFRRYTSGTDQWGEETALTRKINGPDESPRDDNDGNDDDECTQYFLSKCGNVVSTNIQRSPSKQYASILTLEENGDEVLYFLSSSGTVVACNLRRGFFFEYPRLLPVFSEYSIDLVECGGKMYVVLLCELFESASVRVWKWDDVVKSWRQTAAMPPCMSHKFYGKKVDINCCGAAGGGRIMVCVNSAEICSYVMCDLGKNEWVELPECCVDGDEREFVCGFSFEPRIEALC